MPFCLAGLAALLPPTRCQDQTAAQAASHRMPRNATTWPIGIETLEHCNTRNPCPLQLQCSLGLLEYPNLAHAPTNRTHIEVSSRSTISDIKDRHALKRSFFETSPASHEPDAPLCLSHTPNNLRRNKYRSNSGVGTIEPRQPGSFPNFIFRLGVA